MNGQPGASWLELNGNVKLATDSFCLSAEGPRLTRKHKQDNTATDCQRLTVSFHASPLKFSSLWTEAERVREIDGWEVRQKNRGGGLKESSVV